MVTAVIWRYKLLTSNHFTLHYYRCTHLISSLNNEIRSNCLALNGTICLKVASYNAIALPQMGLSASKLLVKVQLPCLIYMQVSDSKQLIKMQLLCINWDYLLKSCQLRCNWLASNGTCSLKVASYHALALPQMGLSASKQPAKMQFPCIKWD